MHDVIVIGAGPVGSYTAFLLAKEGLDVAILEKKSVIGKDVNCTGIVSEACLRKLDLEENVVLRAICSIRAIAPSGDYLRYHSADPIAYVVDRSLFDREINKMAVTQGAITCVDTAVNSIHITDSAFITKTTSEGMHREFRAKAGVIATGFELHSLPLKFRRPANFLFGAQADVIMSDLDDVEVYFGEGIAPGSFGWVVPTNSKSAKIGIIVKRNPVELINKFMETPFIRNRLNTRKRVKCSPVPITRIPKSYGERLVIVGEAAGQVKATTGGGIYFGLLCAEIAVQTIKKAFRCGDYGETIFAEYEKAWRKSLEPELKAGKVIRNIFSRLSDHHINLLIDLAKKDGILPVIQNTHFDWHKDIVNYLIRHLINAKLFGKKEVHS